MNGDVPPVEWITECQYSWDNPRVIHPDDFADAYAIVAAGQDPNPQRTWEWSKALHPWCGTVPDSLRDRADYFAWAMSDYLTSRILKIIRPFHMAGWIGEDDVVTCDACVRHDMVDDAMIGNPDGYRRLWEKYDQGGPIGDYTGNWFPDEPKWCDRCMTLLPLEYTAEVWDYWGPETADKAP
jgi:hypothetical protein